MMLTGYEVVRQKRQVNGMRRKDRERSAEFGFSVIDESDFGTLAVLDNSDIPYAVPLSIARKGSELYFHAAKSGTKNSLLTDGTHVRVVFVGRSRVPDVLPAPKIREAILAGKAPSLFTTTFRSAIVTGTIRAVSDAGEKREALRLISEKYTPQYMAYFDEAFASGEALTAVCRIQIDTVTAKEKA